MENELEERRPEGTTESAAPPEQEPAAAVEPNREANEEKGAEKQENPEKQSREENAQFAAKRREVERQQEIQKQVESQLHAFYEKLRTACESPELDGAVQELMSAGIEPELACKAAESMQKSRIKTLAEEQVQKAERQQALRQTVAAQLEELNRAFPECGILTGEQLQSEEKLCEKAAQMPNGSLVDAYKLLHYDEMRQAAAAAARQEAINQLRGAEHLHSIDSGGRSGQGGLTEDEYESYRLFGFSRSEAARAHQKLYGR